MSAFTIWIDADAAPRDVKEIVYRAALRVEAQTILVSNQRITPPANNPHASAVRVAGGPDEADRYIVEHAAAGDLAVTADIPLAADLVANGVVVLDHRGEAYTEENVRERLSIRDFMDQLRSTGVETGGPKAYGQRDKQAFANAFDRALTAALRASKG